MNGERNELLIQVKEVKKEYRTGNVITSALRGIDLEIHRGDFRLILGPSGCGKTTLLNILGGISTVTSGSVLVKTQQGLKDISKFSKKELTDYRRFTVGIIFQFYNLIPILTALENVELSARLAGIRDPQKKAVDFLDLVGLKDKYNRYPAQLSGGEQQRVAIARVLVKNPPIILADEPTGNLDSRRSVEIYALLYKISKEFNTAILIVTHNANIAESDYGSQHIHIVDGQLVKE